MRLFLTSLLLLSMLSSLATAETPPEAPASPTAATAPAAEAALSPTAAMAPGVVPVAGPQPLTPAAFIASAAKSVDAELALLDGGPLSAALLDAARNGRSLRLLLDPSQLSTRLQGVALQNASPTAQVRWKPRAGKKQRRLIADGTGLLTWGPAQANRVDGGVEALQQAGQRFERLWGQAAQQLPEGQRLDDALQALPDPRENAPHFIRRREATGE